MGYNNALKLYSVYTLMAIVNSSLIILSPRCSTKRPINRAEAVLERSTSVVDDLCIALQDLRKKKKWLIPRLKIDGDASCKKMARWNAITPERRNAGTPEYRNTKTRNTKLLKTRNA